MLLKFTGAPRPLDGSARKVTDNESPTVDSLGLCVGSEANVKLKRIGVPTVLPMMMFMGRAAAYSASETNRTPLTETPVTSIAFEEAANRTRKEKTQANRFIITFVLLQLILIQNSPDTYCGLFSKNMQDDGFLP